MLLNIQKNLDKVNNYQKMLSTGKQLTKPSDNPIDTAKSLSLRQAISNTEQYKRNIDDSLGWLNSTDVALSGMSSSFQRVRELILQAANDTTNADNRANMADEIESIKQSVVEIANTTHAGRYIFSGSMTKSSPLDVSYNYVGDGLNLTREVSKGNSISVNMTAGDILRVDTTVPYNANPIGGNSILVILDNLISLLNLEKDFGLRPPASDISAYLNQLDPVLDNLTNTASNIGVQINRLDDIQSRHEDALLNLTGLLSKKEDVDMTRLITQLQIAQNVHEASLAAAARIIQPSLMDFLR
jgi:flagellar hook-associated protein 3 FlgL